MSDFRKNAARFFYRNSGKGIPNLMLYIAIGNVIVFVFSLVDPSNVLYNLLAFDRTLILQGQVWRLFSYIFTYLLDATGLSIFFQLLFLYCYYWMGRQLEQFWGTLRFNLYYLTGVVLMDVGALLLGMQASTYYLNMSLFLAIATIIPDTQFLLFFIIPVKAKYLAWIDIGLTLYGIVSQIAALTYAGGSLIGFLRCLFPLIAMLNYVLFFGKDIQNLFPNNMRYRRPRHNPRPARPRPDPNWSSGYRSSTGERPYHHKCTVCGRTDVSNPELEFRYCSKCKGYYCYCSDHINNHAHIQ